jgi:hypothetical protein
MILRLENSSPKSYRNFFFRAENSSPDSSSPESYRYFFVKNVVIVRENSFCQPNTEIVI